MNLEDHMPTTIKSTFRSSGQDRTKVPGDASLIRLSPRVLVILLIQIREAGFQESETIPALQATITSCLLVVPRSHGCPLGVKYSGFPFAECPPCIHTNAIIPGTPQRKFLRKLLLGTVKLKTMRMVPCSAYTYGGRQWITRTCRHSSYTYCKANGGIAEHIFCSSIHMAAGITA